MDDESTQEVRKTRDSFDHTSLRPTISGPVFDGFPDFINTLLVTTYTVQIHIRAGTRGAVRQPRNRKHYGRPERPR